MTPSLAGAEHEKACHKKIKSMPNMFSPEKPIPKQKKQ